MRLERARVISQEEVAQDTFLMWLDCPAMAGGSAGRFLMLHCGDGADPLLPRPMSYHRFREAAGQRQFAILYDVRGRGTEWLSRRHSGDEIEGFGPLGKGAKLRPQTRNLLLVAGGLGIAALPPLMDETIAAGGAVTLLQGARSAAKLLPTSLLPAEVEVVSATDDGSLGHKGQVTELLPQYLSWADQVIACGPAAMFRSMVEVVRASRAGRSRQPIDVLMEEHMACGTGICYGCGIFTPKGVRLVCKDGPAFELRDLFR
ncbi:MAG TPA: dihydroorotate dehydrogenase electron transfer subunit [Dehalococcoidia bacterium]|nr:dihydroorotate dehydrogenase electron transfer subunit [Dehalococcoidia bacterium]